MLWGHQVLCYGAGWICDHECIHSLFIDVIYRGYCFQTYAVLDWQNQEQRPVKAPDNEWFTVQYSEVHFDASKWLHYNLPYILRILENMCGVIV